MYVWVGPWTYTGSGTSYSVTLTGGDFDLTSSSGVSTSLAVTLYNATQNQVLAYAIPSGSPLTLESPKEFFYYQFDGYTSYNALSCATSQEDGNCGNLSFESYLYAPGASPVTSEIQIINLTRGTTVFLGPITITGGGGANTTWNLSPQLWGLAPGQVALNQSIEAQLIDANTSAVLDTKNLGSFNLEYPPAYIASSSVSCVTSGSNGCENFILTIDADAPANGTETSYAAVTNTTNGQYVWVGPWTYNGSGSSYAVTLSGGDFGATSAGTAASLKVLLYNSNQQQILDSSTPSGASLTLQAPEESFYYDNSYQYNYLSCAATAEDGNCANFRFNTELETASGSSPVTSEIQLIDLTAGVTVFLGPVTLNAGTDLANTWYLSPQLFGLAPGQQALDQVFVEQLVDANTSAVLDQKDLGSLNLEYPADYIASSSIACLTSDANGHTRALC